MGRAITRFYALGDAVVKRRYGHAQEVRNTKVRGKELNLMNLTESNTRREGLASGRSMDNPSLAAGGKAERRGTGAAGWVDVIEGAWGSWGRSPQKDCFFFSVQ